MFHWFSARKERVNTKILPRYYAHDYSIRVGMGSCPLYGKYEKKKNTKKNENNVLVYVIPGTYIPVYTTKQQNTEKARRRKKTPPTHPLYQKKRQIDTVPGRLSSTVHASSFRVAFWSCSGVCCFLGCMYSRLHMCLSQHGPCTYVFGFGLNTKPSRPNRNRTEPNRTTSPTRAGASNVSNRSRYRYNNFI